MDNSFNKDIRLPRTKQSTLFEVVLAIVIIVEGVVLYRITKGDTGVMTMAVIMFLVAALLMGVAYRPRWINMPVDIKNYRQVELEAQCSRVLAIVISFFPALFAKGELMEGSTGTVIGIGFSVFIMIIVFFYVWRMERAGK